MDKKEIENSEAKKYPKFSSKNGLVIPIVYIILISAIVLIWVLPVVTKISNDLLPKITLTIIISIILVIFTWAVFSSYYVLMDDFLTIVSGPFRSHIYYKEITQISPSKNFWASLSLSIDRVKIKRGKNPFTVVFVSPKQKELFIDELRNRIEDKNQSKEENK